MRFAKYHALGNDYLLLQDAPTQALVRAVCDRRRGVGADGVLVEGVDAGGRPALRVFNPDGSEAETSGNGLRIFARYLWDRGRVGGAAFEVATKGGVVRCRVHDGGGAVSVDMGRASFGSAMIPVTGLPREVVGARLEALGAWNAPAAEAIAALAERLRFTAVTVGNPHCVVHGIEPAVETTLRLGPALETHPAFPRRTNVQFVRVVDRGRIEVEVWERGAGRTLASGSSACAAAAASVRLGLCDGAVTVSMAGGELQVGVSPAFDLTLLGPVRLVAEGTLAEEFERDAGG